MSRELSGSFTNRNLDTIAPVCRRASVLLQQRSKVRVLAPFGLMLLLHSFVSFSWIVRGSSSRSGNVLELRRAGAENSNKHHPRRRPNVYRVAAAQTFRAPFRFRINTRKLEHCLPLTSGSFLRPAQLFTLEPAFNSSRPLPSQHSLALLVTAFFLLPYPLPTPCSTYHSHPSLTSTKII
jgi:hypothetical protein